MIKTIDILFKSYMLKIKRTIIKKFRDRRTTEKTIYPVSKLINVLLKLSLILIPKHLLVLDDKSII